MPNPLYTGGPLIEAVPPRVFDYTAIGQRRASFSFALVGIDGYRDPTPLTPLRGSNPSISHDTTRTVKRTLSLALGVDDTARFDPVYHRVEVAMTVGGVAYPLGRYMAADRTRVGSTGGDQASVAYTDEMAQVAVPLERGFSSPQAGNNGASNTGENIATLVRLLLRRFRLFDPRNEWGAVGTQTLETGGYIPVEIDVEPTPFLSATAWRAGTSGGQVLEDLAVVGDYWSPWLDNRGTFRMIRSFDPAAPSVAPLADWDATDAPIRGSVSYTDDLLTASNRFVVISNKGAGANATREITGTYDTPADAPWSIANRGFVVPEIHDVQVASDTAATVVARNIGRRQQVFERAQVSTPPDPRHDSYDVIRWRGVPWLELAWTLQLTEGAPMTHTLRRAYTDA
jgi:hypothetical protein